LGRIYLHTKCSHANYLAEVKIRTSLFIFCLELVAWSEPSPPIYPAGCRDTYCIHKQRVRALRKFSTGHRGVKKSPPPPPAGKGRVVSFVQNKREATRQQIHDVRKKCTLPSPEAALYLITSPVA
jgi:hypothetical protein